MSKRPFDAFDYIVDDGTIEDPLYDVQEYRNRKSCLDGIDPNGSQIILLRITGAGCVIFGIIEIAFGSYLFDEFVNADAGAWWAVLVLPIAGKNVVMMKLLLPVLQLLISNSKPVRTTLFITFQRWQYEQLNCPITSMYSYKFCVVFRIFVLM